MIFPQEFNDDIELIIMCGICGFNWEDKSLIKKMGKSIKHRGPNQKGLYTDTLVSLYHQRLSIIDLSEKGKQPMSNEDGSIWITYNGEVYNYNELRPELERRGHRFVSNTDTEIIIHAYEEYGAECLKMFNGMFSFCIYDMKKKQLFLARDRIGIKPLYYYFKNNKFIFASEIKSILECDIKREVSIDSLNKFMMLRYTPGEETMFRDIKRLKSGHSMVFDLETNKLSIQKYWDIVESVQNESEDYFSHKLLSLMEKSVKKRLVGDVPLGAYLSGGIDSSTMVAIMRKLSPEGDIKTFSVAFEEATKYNELSEARIASEHFETNHKEFIIDDSVLKSLPEIVWHMDEPLADPAIIPNFFLSREAKKDVTIILTGDGSDELFAGYDQYKFLVMERHLRKLPRPVTMSIPKMIKGLPDSLMDKIYKQGTDTGKQEMIRRLEKSITSGRNHAKAYLEIVSIYNEDEREKVLAKNVKSQVNDFNCYDSFNKDYLSKPRGYLNKFQYFDINVLLPECYLMKLDKMTMAHSIEGRVPFLDHEIAEFSLKIPPKLKLKNNITKYVLKRAVRGLIPPSTTKRKKQTFFVPINKWVTNNFEHFQELLSKEELRCHGFFNYDYVNKILQRKSKLFYARQLWNLINFQIWHKIYIDKEKVLS